MSARVVVAVVGVLGAFAGGCGERRDDAPRAASPQNEVSE